MHVGGEVHRIVLDGVAPPPGDTLRAQARFLEREADGLRQLLLYEPRGGLASLNADLVVAARHPDAEAGLIIMEFMGYPLFSGSNFMASAIALLETGRLPMSEGDRPVVLEAPGGLATVVAECRDGRVINTTCESSTAAYVAEQGGAVEVPGYGTIAFDLVWSGVFYPVIDAAALGFALTKDEEASLQAFGHAFVEAARPDVRPTHPQLGDVGPLSFALLAGPAKADASGALARRVASYVHPGSVCRCPSGTGTTAVIVPLAQAGLIGEGESLLATSWFGTSFIGTIRQCTTIDERLHLKVATSSPGWLIARTEMVVDLDDPMTPAAGLEALLRA